MVIKQNVLIQHRPQDPRDVICIDIAINQI